MKNVITEEVSTVIINSIIAERENIVNCYKHCLQIAPEYYSSKIKLLDAIHFYDMQIRALYNLALRMDVISIEENVELCNNVYQKLKIIADEIMEEGL